MELLKDIEIKTNNYTKKIKSSNYIQTYEVKDKKVIVDNMYRYFKSIDELMISINEPDYYFDENKELYFNKIKIDIASKLDENKKELYDKFNYSKFFDISLIQTGLQQINKLSTLIYLSNYYDTNIYIKHSDAYYNYLDKNTKNIYVICDSNGWKISEKDFDLEKIDVLPMDKFIKTSFIDNNLKKGKPVYNLFLESFSKYKIGDLIDIATKNDISLVDKNGKKKIKKQLYDDINYKYL